MKKIMNHLRAGLVAIVIVAFAGMSVQAQQVWDKTVTVNPKPYVTLKGVILAPGTPTSQILCQNGDVILTFKGTPPFTLSYTVDVSGALNSANNGTGKIPESIGLPTTFYAGDLTDLNIIDPSTGAKMYTAKINPGMVGTFTFNLTSVSDAVSCPNDTAKIATYVINPAPEVTHDASVTDLCVGDKHTLTFDKGVAPYTLKYKENGTELTVTTGTGSNPVTLDIPARYAGEGDYVFVELKDANNCPSIVTPLANWNVKVHELPTITIEKTTYCQNDTAKVAFTGKAPFAITWAGGNNYGLPASFDVGTGLNDLVEGTEIDTYNTDEGHSGKIGDYNYSSKVIAGSAGTFAMSADVADANGCKATITSNIRVNAAPSVDITPVELCQNAPIALTFKGTGANPTFSLEYCIDKTGGATGITPATIGLPTTFTPTIQGTDANNGTANTYTATVNPGQAGTFIFKLWSVSDGTCTVRNPDHSACW